MAQILCLTCKETVVFGERCKCFFYENLNEQPEVYLKELLISPEVSAQPVNKSKGLVNKGSELIESTKDSNTALRFPENNPDFITSQNEKLDSLSTPGMFAYKLKTDDYASRTNKKTYECDKCKEFFFNRSSFLRHLKSHSSKSLNVYSNSQRGMSCKDQLEKHNIEKAFACNVCKKLFSKITDLTNHNIIHTKKSFVCDICKKLFIHKSTLIRHYRTHTKEKPYVCDFCKNKFSHKWNLIQHRRIHTKEKPFVCKICERGFAHQSHLVRHYRTHTGEKPHECDKCKKRFSRTSHLNQHYKTHTNEKPFGCDLCEKRFKHRSTLVCHRRKHMGEKP